MALQYSVAVRNARLDAIETTISTGPVLQLRTGSPPANCAASASGTLLAELTLPSDWMGNAASGAKGLSGTWSGVASANGVAGHFRLLESTGATCHIQGSISGSGGGGDMELDSTTIAISDTINIASFDLTGGNA